MFNNNSIENLELKLAQTRKERAEVLEKTETEYKKEYSEFFDCLLGNEKLGIKRYISAYFQLEKVDNLEKSNGEILKHSLIKTIDILNLSNNDKKDLFEKINLLTNKKEDINDIFVNKTDISKDENFPILTDLVNSGNLDKEDLVNISFEYKNKKDFLESIIILDKNKIELIKSNYYLLHETTSSEKIENFENDFKTEIKNSENIKKYPKIIKFVGKNYFKLKLKNNVETKKERLKRMFKLAFMKLYKLKKFGIDINEILKKIDNIDDFESYISLLIKYFEHLKQNPNLQKDFIVSSEFDEINELKDKAESNKEKILFSESKIVKGSTLLEKGEKYIGEHDLNKLLSKDVDIIGDEFVNREMSAGILNEEEEIEDEEDEKYKEVNLEEYLEELKKEFFELEEKKKKIFLEGEYEELDLVNDKFIYLELEIKKVLKLLGIEEE